MNDKTRTLHGRVAELNPFDNGLCVKASEVTSPQRTRAWREGFTNLTADELYGCVDWYQYPDQSEDSPGSNMQAAPHEKLLTGKGRRPSKSALSESRVN